MGIFPVILPSSEGTRPVEAQQLYDKAACSNRQRLPWRVT
jgi:hypothetical protein